MVACAELKILSLRAWAWVWAAGTGGPARARAGAPARALLGLELEAWVATRLLAGTTTVTIVNIAISFFGLLSLGALMTENLEAQRVRARELGVKPGVFAPGALNAITD